MKPLKYKLREQLWNQTQSKAYDQVSNKVYYQVTTEIGIPIWEQQVFVYIGNYYETT